MGPKKECRLPFPMASYIPAFIKAMFHWMVTPIDFILWHATVLAFNTFLHLSLILYEFWTPLWSISRKMWRQSKKAASLSGEVDAVLTFIIPTLRVCVVPLMTPFLSMYIGGRGITSQCRRMRVLLYVFVPHQLSVSFIFVKR